MSIRTEKSQRERRVCGLAAIEVEPRRFGSFIHHKPALNEFTIDILAGEFVASGADVHRLPESRQGITAERVGPDVLEIELSGRLLAITIGAPPLERRRF
jgi:hypothetical protein